MDAKLRRFFRRRFSGKSATQRGETPFGGVPLIVAILVFLGTAVTADLTFRAAQRASDVHLSEIALTILKASPTDDVAALREWAMDVIDSANSRKFTPAERQSLSKKPIAVAAPIVNPCPVVERNQEIAEYSQYSLLIFYKTSRVSDCQSLTKALAEAGFRAAAIPTTFDEVKQYHQFGRPDGSNFIMASSNGMKIANTIQAISKKSSPKVDVTISDPTPMSRGDVQINLY